MKINIGKKIAFSFTLLVAVIILISCYCLVNLAKSNALLKELYEKDLLGVQYIGLANVDLIKLEQAETNLLSAENFSERSKLIASIKDYSSKFENHIEKYKSTAGNKAGEKDVQEISDLWKQLLPLQDKTIELVKRENKEEAVQLKEKIKVISDKIETKISIVSVQRNNQAKESFENSNLIYNSMFVTLVIVILCATIFSIIIGFAITRLIVKPVIKISDAAVKISNGNLSIEEIVVKNRDEIGALSGAFNKMISQLKSIIMQMAQVTGTVSKASEELSACSQQNAASAEQIANTISNLAQGAADQSQQLENADLVINNINKVIQISAQKTKEASISSINVAEAANKGAAIVKDAVKSINKIKESSSKTTNAIFVLGHESERIGHIVEVIAGIAAQTNLLALNAAIEAARAGEYGRGFAVVAEEIRKLAEQSSVSTGQITDLIENIRIETGNVRIAILENYKVVDEGVAVVENAGSFFNLITSDIGEVVNQIAQVNSMSNEIASGSVEIVEIMESISSISRMNAASSQEVMATSQEQTSSMEEISGASQELSNMAVLLKNAVSKFIL